MCFWSKTGFTLVSGAMTGPFCNFDGEVSCVLCFFRLGKYTKKS